MSCIFALVVLASVSDVLVQFALAPALAILGMLALRHGLMESKQELRDELAHADGENDAVDAMRVFAQLPAIVVKLVYSLGCLGLIALGVGVLFGLR